MMTSASGSSSVSTSLSRFEALIVASSYQFLNPNVPLGSLWKCAR
jgi:hypothetical protein